MSNPRAIAYMDDGCLKIVFKGSVKKFESSDLGSREVVKFLAKIFSSFDVYVVQKVSKAASPEEMLAALSGKPVAQEPPPPSTFSHAQEAMPPRMAPPMPSEPEPPVTDVDILSGNIQGVYLKSMSPTTIIVDDLPVGGEVRNTGRPLTLVIQAGRPVNLGHLDPEHVKKSSILRGLLANKTLVPIGPGEATILMAEFDEEQAKIEDDRLDQWAPIVDSKEGTMRAAASAVGGGGDEPMVLGPTSDVEELDLTSDVRGGIMGSSNEDSGSMEELMQAMSAQDEINAVDLVELTPEGMTPVQPPETEGPARGRIRRK
jgi:hypothetical protein